MNSNFVVMIYIYMFSFGLGWLNSDMIKNERSNYHNFLKNEVSKFMVMKTQTISQKSEKNEVSTPEQIHHENANTAIYSSKMIS